MTPSQRQLLDDLLWAVNSPWFMAGAQTHSELVERDVDVAALEAAIGEPARRVGHYFEALVDFWLRDVRGVEMVGAGVQLHDGTRTIGELDFVFRDEAGQLCHVETAVKFYLHDPSRPGSHYPGPNATDDFETKAARLFGHQLPLSAQPYPDVTVRTPHVKGCCFVHPHNTMPSELPEHMMASHEQGTWVRSRELELLIGAWPDARAVELAKPFWLTPGGRTGVPMHELSYPVDTPPTMVVLVDGAGEPVRRVCVVGDEW